MENNESPKNETHAAPEAPAPFAVFPDAESFNKRVAREAKKALSELGVDDPMAVKSALAELESLRAAKIESERAQMTELERYKTDLAAHQAELEKMRTEAEEARTHAKMHAAFGKVGVKNHDYAIWRCVSAANALAEDEQLDLDAYLSQLAADPREAIALGIASPEAPPAPPPTINRPANTSPNTSAPQPPQANAAPPVRTTMDMSPAEWAAYKQQIGVHV